jgi:hypothetical protein
VKQLYCRRLQLQLFHNAISLRSWLKTQPLYMFAWKHNASLASGWKKNACGWKKINEKEQVNSRQKTRKSK